ncbi:MAG: hypothetical protein Q8J78_13130 [Moraxellaceae bacterium]|nr:hypothetical protein [Moraxellaceae bacterium]
MLSLLAPRGYVQVFKNKMVISIPSRGISVVKEANFSHSRMLVGEFEIAEQLLKEGIKEAYSGGILLTRPQIIMHPKESLEGGFTMIEQRVLRELALGAGAAKTYIRIGQDLSKEEVEAFKE